MLRVGNAPTSWGIEQPEAEGNPRWETFLDEVKAAGYAGVELGPYGYLPTDPERLRDALAERELQLSGGYILSSFHDPRQYDDTIAHAERVCGLLESQGASQLVLISAIVQDRTPTAGRSADAPRLNSDDAGRLAATIGTLTSMAADHGLRPGIHQHAGTHIEFEDEIEALLDDARSKDCGLVVDTGHLTFAGIDPAKLIDSYGDRVNYVHAKDVDGVVHARMIEGRADFWEAYRAGVFCVLGSGAVDFSSVRTALERIGYEGWLTVEQDADPRGGSIPLVDARKSLAFLRDEGFDTL